MMAWRFLSSSHSSPWEQVRSWSFDFLEDVVSNLITRNNNLEENRNLRNQLSLMFMKTLSRINNERSDSRPTALCNSRRHPSATTFNLKNGLKSFPAHFLNPWTLGDISKRRITSHWHQHFFYYLSYIHHMNLKASSRNCYYDRP